MADGERCDLCNSSTDVKWVWITENEATSLEEAEEKGLFWAEDSEWAVCDQCHRLILEGKDDAIRARAFLNLKGMITASFDPMTESLMLVDMTEHVTSVHDAFWMHKTEYREDA